MARTPEVAIDHAARGRCHAAAIWAPSAMAYATKTSRMSVGWPPLAARPSARAAPPAARGEGFRAIASLPSSTHGRTNVGEKLPNASCAASTPDASNMAPAAMAAVGGRRRRRARR